MEHPSSSEIKGIKWSTFCHPSICWFENFQWRSLYRTDNSENGHDCLLNSNSEIHRLVLSVSILRNCRFFLDALLRPVNSRPVSRSWLSSGRGLSQLLPAMKGSPRSSPLSQFQRIMKVPPLPSQAKEELSSPMECFYRHSSQSARSSSACLKIWVVSLSVRSWLISLALNDSFNCSGILNYSHVSLIIEFGSLYLTGRIVNYRNFIDCSNSK
jgi:hypothetical protein